MTARDISLLMAVAEDQNGIPTDQSNENGPVEGENPKGGCTWKKVLRLVGLISLFLITYGIHQVDHHWRDWLFHNLFDILDH